MAARVVRSAIRVRIREGESEVNFGNAGCEGRRRACLSDGERSCPPRRGPDTSTLLPDRSHREHTPSPHFGPGNLRWPARYDCSRVAHSLGGWVARCPPRRHDGARRQYCGRPSDRSDRIGINLGLFHSHPRLCLSANSRTATLFLTLKDASIFQSSWDNTRRRTNVIPCIRVGKRGLGLTRVWIHLVEGTRSGYKGLPSKREARECLPRCLRVSNFC